MDIIDRLKIEARREPHEPIWRDAIEEIARLRAALKQQENAMDFKTAKRILLDMQNNFAVFDDDPLSNGGYVFALANNGMAQLDGDFTADQLEAIAALVRNPSACVAA